MKKLFFFLVLFVRFLTNAQSNTNEIDLLIKKLDSAYTTLNHEFTIKTAFKVVNQSKEINYAKGLVIGNRYLANTLSQINQFEKSTAYIQKAKQYKKYLEGNPMENFKLDYIMAENYEFSGLNTLAKEKYRDAYTILTQQRNSFKQQKGLLFIDIALHCINYDKKEYDSAYYHINRARNLVNSPSYKGYGDSLDKGLVYMHLGGYYLSQAKTDSAKLYYNRSLTYVEEKNSYYETYTYYGLSKLYDSIGDYKKAILYSQKALKNAEQFQVVDDVQKYYRSLANLYNKTGNREKEKEYDIRYKKITDSINHIKTKERDLLLRHFLSLQNEEIKTIKSKNYKTILIIIAIVLIGLLLLTWYIYLQRKKKLQLVIENEKKLSQSKVILRKKEEEAKALKEKINPAFEEVVQLAKENHPGFLARFKEIYPEFCESITKIYPEIITSELVFCAYLKLHFSTKDIAKYTFVTPKAIQNRKNRIRKKLNIPSDTDIYIWMDTIE